MVRKGYISQEYTRYRMFYANMNNLKKANISLRDII